LQELKESLVTVEQEQEEANQAISMWPLSDHDAFMRVVRLFRRQTADIICDSLQDKLPKYSRDEIADHLHWYVTLELVNLKKRELVSKWRHRMEELEQDAAEADEANLHDDLKCREHMRRRSLTPKQQAKLAKWKLGQLLAKEKAQVEKRNQEREQAQAEKEKRKKEERQRESQKKKVRQFNDEKYSKETENEKIIALERQQLRVSRETLKRIESRTAELLRKRSDAQAALQASNERDVKHTPTSKYQNVESRLHCPTVSSESKMRIMESDVEFEAVFRDQSLLTFQKTFQTTLRR
jgi:hypothetical protein